MHVASWTTTMTPVFRRESLELRQLQEDVRDLARFLMAMDAKLDRLLYHFELDNGEEEDRDR